MKAESSRKRKDYKEYSNLETKRRKTKYHEEAQSAVQVTSNFHKSYT